MLETEHSRPMAHLSDAEVARQLRQHRAGGNRSDAGRATALNPLNSLMAEAERALGYRDGGSIDNPHRTPMPAASRTMIDLSQFIADGNPSPNVYGVQNRPTGETLTIDPRAVIEQHSVVAQAGARIIIATPRDRAIPIASGDKTDGLMGFYQDVQLFRNEDPAQFATLADGADATVSAIPTHDATFTWPEVPTAAFRVTVTRAQNRALGGGDDLRDALLRSILMGLGLYADKLLLAAIAAATPAAFSFGAAAAKFLKVDDLRAVIGTTGAGAGYRGDGAFVASPGIEAEITDATAGTYIGAFGSAAVAIWPEITVQARRMSVMGDLEVTCLVNAQAVLPDSGKFFAVAA